jgi:uncharacterized small protein (DUF1192 family)
MLTLIKQFIAIMKSTMERLIMKSLGLKHLETSLRKMNLETVTLDGEETTVKDNDISIDDLAEAIADLTIEVKVLEAKVQRLSEFRDTAGYVPISETGGKQ